MIIAGIGARLTPSWALQEITRIAYEMGKTNEWTLRSGRAPGADQAWEYGFDKADANKEIYLPVPKFPYQYSYTEQEWRPAGQGIVYPKPSAAALQMLNAITNGKSESMGYFKRQAFARNLHQLFGRNLDTPTDLVIGWAPVKINDEPIGGTGFTMQIATRCNIRVINLSQLDNATLRTDIWKF